MHVNQAIQQAVETFVSGVERVVQQSVQQRIASVLQNLGTPPRTGRPPKLSLVPAQTNRKPHPIQLCPVPDCKKPAAPSLGMVCLDHKGVSPKVIARYRKGRRFAKKNNLSFAEVMKNWDKYRRKID
jgi:hypothetical protein